jgi:hypothetical protein
LKPFTWHRQLAHVRHVTLAAKFLIPKMFAQVSQGNMSAQDAVSAADHDMKVIYKKWRDAGKSEPLRH